MSDQPQGPRDEVAPASGRGQQTFEGVQFLRGAAASLVVFHHMCHAITTYRPGESAIAGYESLAKLGAAGVDIFFCISGLVIAYASQTMPAGWPAARRFAWRRVLRVIPPYWAFTFVLLALWVIGVGFKDLVMTPGLVAASLFLIPYPKMTFSGDLSYHPILDVGWTLAFEMYFYAICAIVIAFFGGRRIWPFILVGLAACAIASLALTGSGSLTSSVLASPLLIEFAGGVFLARFVAGRRSIAIGSILVVVGGMALLLSIFVADPMPARVLYWGVPGFLLVCGVLLLPIGISTPAARLFAFLGTASYSIYLAHPMFLLPLGTLLKRGYFAAIPADLLLILVTIGGIAGSALSYFVVEGPLVRALKPRSRTAAMAREAVST